MVKASRRSAFTAVALAVALGAASCSGQGSSSPSPSATTASSATSTTPAPVVPTTPSSSPATSSSSAAATSVAAPAPAAPTATLAPTSTPTQATAPGECTADQLTITLGKLGAAGGSSEVPIVFTNSSDRTCFVRAYPGVAAIDDSGAQLAQADRTLDGILSGATGISTIALNPGQAASAGVDGVDVATGDATDCVQPVGFLVTPPNARTSTEVRGEVPPLCSGLKVHPVVAGTLGGRHSSQ